ncbi:Tubby-like F-box protein 8 [Vitis vinifera]|uniref:Tubby-like F-box protein 8 n=1 Tax=Vitis vinifera TaxID=29760 RepID=A0A438J0U1_VITVI|nr:Tubby-like F-box protein 8 [Vitis vinifera]
MGRWEEGKKQRVEVHGKGVGHLGCLSLKLWSSDQLLVSDYLRSLCGQVAGHSRGKSIGSFHELHDQPLVIQNSRWANLPPELLYDIIKRLEESESTWPSRKHVVACAAVCRSWRTMSLLVENGKFLLSAKRNRRTTCTEYVISMDAENISRSSSTYIGKLRSNFLGTKFIIYDTQPPHTCAHIPPPGRTSKRFYSKKVSPKVPTGSYNIAHITYELNVLGTRGPRRMHCTMHSIPASSLDAGGSVPGQPELLPVLLKTHSGASPSQIHWTTLLSSAALDFLRFVDHVMTKREKQGPWFLKTRLQDGTSNYNAATQPAAGAPTPSQPAPPEHDKIILQFGKVGKDMFTMDYRYPLSAFQAFAICLSSFDTKLACE